MGDSKAVMNTAAQGQGSVTVMFDFIQGGGMTVHEVHHIDCRQRIAGVLGLHSPPLHCTVIVVRVVE